MNHFSKTVLVKGVSFFADRIDGQDINSGSLFIEEQLDEKRGTAKGFRTVEYRCPDSTIAKSLLANTFPVPCEVTFEIVTSKKAQVIMVVGAVPQLGKVSQPQPMPKVQA